MNYSEEQTKRILDAFDKMTIEDYEKLYDKCKGREKVSLLLIDWDKYNNDKKIYLKRFKSSSTCNGCYLYENLMNCTKKEKKKYKEACEKGKCVINSQPFIYKKVIPLNRYKL